MASGILASLGSLATTLVALLLAASTATAGERIDVRPAAFTLLAESLIGADEAARLGFADILLAAMQDAYLQEIARAGTENTQYPKRSLKLRRWRNALSGLVEQLANARLALTEGARAVIRVDAKSQVLLFVDQQPFAFSVPRPADQELLQRRVVADYCAVYDCRILDGLADTSRPRIQRPVGSWSLQDGTSPAFVVDGIVACRFSNLYQRARKQRWCQQIATDALRVSEAVSEADRRQYRIDAAAIALGPRKRPPDLIFTLNTRGDYVVVAAPYLAQLRDSEWQVFAKWLSDNAKGATEGFPLRSGTRWQSVPAG